MKCYNHPETDAVGTCKSCSKGICHNCLSDTGNGIACTANCVQELTELNQLIESNKKAHQNAAGNTLITAIIYATAGFVFIFLGLIGEGKYDVMYIVGLTVLILAFLAFKKSYNFSKKNK